jgi:hypothetical protein
VQKITFYVLRRCVTEQANIIKETYQGGLIMAEDVKVRMQNSKPVIVAQNNESGSFAAGCPAKDTCRGGSANSSSGCKACERTN